VSSKATKISSGPLRKAGLNDVLIERLMRQMKKPAVGGAIAGIETIGTAVVFGLAPTCVAAAAAYLVYRIAEQRRTIEASVRQGDGPIEVVTLEAVHVQAQADAQRTDDDGIDADAPGEGEGAGERLP
jgi:hypothetical protein